MKYACYSKKSSSKENIKWRKWQQAGEDYVKQSFIVCNFHKIYRDDQPRRIGWAGRLKHDFFKDAVDF